MLAPDFAVSRSFPKFHRSFIELNAVASKIAACQLNHGRNVIFHGYDAFKYPSSVNRIAPQFILGRGRRNAFKPHIRKQNIDAISPQCSGATKKLLCVASIRAGEAEAMLGIVAKKLKCRDNKGSFYLIASI